MAEKLPDVLAPNLRIVFCGTAASAKSAAVGAYYAGPGNRFWRTLAEVGLTPAELSPREFRRLPEFGLGLTDLVKTRAGNDDTLDGGAFDAKRLRRSIERWQPHILCFNGKRAAAEFTGVARPDYGPLPDGIGGTRLFVAPSTSAAARRSWDIQIWWALAALVKPKGSRSAQRRSPLAG